MAEASSVRRLNEPVPARVWLDDAGLPARVAQGVRAPVRVECVLDTWWVDDAWWSERPVRRIYYEVQLVSGQRLVLSWDANGRAWLAQR